MRLNVTKHKRTEKNAIKTSPHWNILTKTLVKTHARWVCILNLLWVLRSSFSLKVGEMIQKQKFGDGFSEKIKGLLDILILKKYSKSNKYF